MNHLAYYLKYEKSIKLCMKKILEHCCMHDRFSGHAKRCEGSFCLRSLKWLFYLIVFLIRISFKFWLCDKNLKNYWILKGCFWHPFLVMHVCNSEKVLAHLFDGESFSGLNTYQNRVSLTDSLSIWIMYYLAIFHIYLKSEEMWKASHSGRAHVRGLKSMYHILKIPFV